MKRGVAFVYLVRSGKGDVRENYQKTELEFTDVVCLITRVPKLHSGWETLTYQGQRYQIFGGIRTPYYINLSNPWKRKRGY